MRLYRMHPYQLNRTYILRKQIPLSIPSLQQTRPWLIGDLLYSLGDAVCQIPCSLEQILPIDTNHIYTVEIKCFLHPPLSHRKRGTTIGLYHIKFPRKTHSFMQFYTALYHLCATFMPLVSRLRHLCHIYATCITFMPLVCHIYATCLEE